MNRKFTIALALSALLVLAATNAGAGVFLKIDGIEGESMADGHKEWIEVESLSTSMNVAPATIAAGTGAARHRGDVILDDITITRKADKASPSLSEAVCKGKVFPKVEIHVTASGDSTSYYRYEMTNVRISSYSVSGGGSAAGDRPNETIAFNFGEVKVTYDESSGMRSKGKGRGHAETTWKVEKGEK